MKISDVLTLNREYFVFCYTKEHGAKFRNCNLLKIVFLKFIALDPSLTDGRLEPLTETDVLIPLLSIQMVIYFYYVVFTSDVLGLKLLELY